MDRSQIARLELNILHKGRWGNAVVSSFRWLNRTYILKDFSHCPTFFRYTIAPVLVRREINALMKLQGLNGIPQEPSRVDNLALTYLFISGKKLSEVDNKLLNSDFFVKLESLVMQMHKRKVAHLDLRRGSNILCRDDGTPSIIDFQSSIIMDKLPERIKRLLQAIDLSGVYKNWDRFAPSSLDSGRRKLLLEINRIRRFWFLKGYPFG